MNIERLKVKWQMNGKIFTAEHERYLLTVQMGGLGWWWNIVKGGEEVDNAYQHSPTNDELSARVQCERCLYYLINQSPK